MVVSKIGYSVFDSPVKDMFLPGARSSAGFPSPADDYLEKSLDLNELLVSNKVATFFMRVEGDSLKASGIRNGDMLIVDRSINPTHGKIVVASWLASWWFEELNPKMENLFLNPMTLQSSKKLSMARRYKSGE